MTNQTKHKLTWPTTFFWQRIYVKSLRGNSGTPQWPRKSDCTKRWWLPGRALVHLGGSKLEEQPLNHSYSDACPGRWGVRLGRSGIHVLEGEGRRAEEEKMGGDQRLGRQASYRGRKDMWVRERQRFLPGAWPWWGRTARAQVLRGCLFPKQKIWVSRQRFNQI